MNKLFEAVGKAMEHATPQGGFKGPMGLVLLILASLAMPIQIIIELFR